jgi:membrane associated rhomboid family serine protease
MTLTIIIITCIISIIAFSNHDLFYRLQFNAYAVAHEKQWYRTFTYTLLHADWMHLFVNIFVLYFFGAVVENYFEYYFEEKATFYFLSLYIGGTFISVLPTFYKYKDSPSYNSVGASGAVSAIVFSSIIMNPMNSICLYGILCLPGIIWAVAYLAYSYYMSKKSMDNINHNAHFTGAVFGIIFTILLKPSLVINFWRQIQDYL